MKIKSYQLLLISLFILTRVYIWVSRPVEFTDVVHNFMAYAHAWARGETPYLKQWYEYPPGTIPLFYLPHVYDRATLNMPFHLDYAQSYRGLMLLFDIGLFIIVWKTLVKFNVKTSVFVGAIVYYCVLTAKAHHFVYDKIDWAFAAVVTLGVTAPILFKERKQVFLEWLGYGLGVSLKLANAPLALIYAVMERKKIKKLFIGAGLAFLITWFIPLAIFRSSLQVMFVYHRIRGLQIESAGAVIASTVNRFTHTEEIIEAYKNYEISGPVSLKIKQIDDGLFMITIILFLIYGTNLTLKSPSSHYPILRIFLTQAFFLLLMLVSKVLSTPFILWPVSLFALYPFKSISQQLKFTIPSFVIIAVSMTKIPDFPLGIFSLHLVIGWIRTLLFVYLLIAWFKLKKELVYAIKL